MKFFSKLFKKSESRGRQSMYNSRRTTGSDVRSHQSGGFLKKANTTMTSGEYRRGRTMPGSTRSGLESADKRAISAATPREKVHHLSRLRRTLLTALGGIIIVTIVTTIVLFQFTAKVKVESKDRYEIADYQPYLASVQNYLSKHPLERLRFNLNSESLNSYVSNEYPEVEKITQEGFDGFASSRFSVVMRKPVVGWDVGASRYFVDANGVSFEKNFYNDPTVKIIDNSGVDYIPGTAIASERFLSFVGRVVSLANAQSLKVERVTIPAGTTRQVQLNIVGYSYPVILSIDRSAGEQVEDMTNALKYLRAQGRDAQYIDLRVRGKAFYRE
jgi:hypothetical protein